MILFPALHLGKRGVFLHSRILHLFSAYTAQGDLGWVFLSILQQMLQIGKGWQWNRSLPRDLGPFTVRSHQTCISGTISPAPGLPDWPAALKGEGLGFHPFQSE